MNYWLIKSEPSVFSIGDLEKSGKTEHWDGVRNYQARNYMKDMRLGDMILFYHSNAETIGIAGLAKVSQEAIADHTQFDFTSAHFDPKATEANPRWFMVGIAFEEKFKKTIPLAVLRTYDELAGMVLLQKGSRLSVQPVTEKEYGFILKLAVTE